MNTSNYASYSAIPDCVSARPSDEPKRTPEVLTEANRTASLVEDIHGGLCNLEARLSGVLRASQPAEKNTAELAAPMRVTSLGRLIAEGNAGAQAAIRRISDLLDRLEV